MSLVPSADFSILYIQSFVYTVYDELAGQRQGPGPSGKSAACCHSHIATTETDTGEPLQPHENEKKNSESTLHLATEMLRQNTSVHTIALANKTTVHTLCKETSLVNIEQEFF